MHIPQVNQEYYNVQNYQQVYEDTAQTWQDQARAERYHRLISAFLKPQVHFAEGVEDRIYQELQDDAQCAIAFTHGEVYDPPHIVAMASQNSVFWPLIGKTMIGAKVSLFTTPIIGKIIPDLGAIPVWRKEGTLSKHGTEEENKALEEIRKNAGKELIHTEIIGMDSGLHMVKHVEGTRNKEDPTKVQRIYDGYGRVVSGVASDKNILMLTGAFYYGVGKDKTKRRPSLVIDVLDDQCRSDPDRIKANLIPALQTTLDMAVARF